MAPNLARLLNAVGLLAISAVLVVAFLDQFVLKELPCPLCILQRAGFVLAGAGLALNLALGIRTAHYALVILGAFTGGAVALRQVALHVVPGTGAYGEPLLGMHLYTWAFLLFALIIAGVATLLLSGRQFQQQQEASGADASGRGRLAQVALLLFTLLVLLNGLSTLAECGGGLCPDDPQGYEAFQALRGLFR
jgi:disulfide bond formation protein DsbB